MQLFDPVVLLNAFETHIGDLIIEHLVFRAGDGDLRTGNGDIKRLLHAFPLDGEDNLCAGWTRALFDGQALPVCQSYPHHRWQ